MLQRNGRVAGLVEPRLPSSAKSPPSGPDWLREIKHDGFRIMARRDAKGVRLITRNGHDFSKRFPLVMAAVATLSTAKPSSATTAGSRGFDLLRSFLFSTSSAVRGLLNGFSVPAPEG